MISVIVPTWEPEDYFYELLNSLKRQSLNCEQYEILIVFNNTSNEKVKIFKKYIEDNFSNARIFSLPEPGVSHARNIGLKASFGDYICFLDDDDIVSENYLENLYSLRCENSIIVSNFFSFKKICEPRDEYLTLKSRFFSKNIIQYRSYFSNVCGKLIPRSMIEGFEFNESLKNGEDALFMYSISFRVKNIVSTEVDTIYYRRLRENSASRKKRNFFKIFFNFIKQVKLYTMYYLSSPFRYSFLFLINRYMALFKRFLMDLGFWK